MANQTCVSTLKAVALRAGRLDDTGALDPGASNLYISDALILVGFEPQIPDRESFEQLDGAGDKCAVYLGPPKPPDSANLTMNLCTLDSELIELLSGGTVVTSGYDSIGYLAPTDDTVNEDGVFFEVWTYAWSGRERALLGSAPAFWRFTFPKTTWQTGQIQLENGISVIPMTGSATPNSQFGTGLTADPFPVDMGDSPYGWALVDEVPTASCGVQALSA